MGSGTSGYINWTITPPTHYHSLVGYGLCDNRHLPPLASGIAIMVCWLKTDRTSLYDR
jgi:hypothetical protein